MTLTQLQYLMVIAETNSLNKAAEQLYMSQPSLTSAMKELERELGRPYRGVPLAGSDLEDARRQLGEAEKNPARYPYHTAWFLVEKKLGLVVGTAHFRGAPDSSGEVEIRYSMGKPHRGRGYMTEAVEAICCWALAQPEVAHITAETDFMMGRASLRILERLGFQKYREEETVWWRL